MKVKLLKDAKIAIDVNLRQVHSFKKDDVVQVKNINYGYKLVDDKNAVEVLNDEPKKEAVKVKEVKELKEDKKTKDLKENKKTK